VVEPRSDVERKVLAKIEQLQPNVPTEIDGCQVVAEAPYFAASGRHCRRVRLTYSDRSPTTEVRVACQNDSHWGVYVPNVLAPTAAGAKKP
jgi:hypothetical protein